MTSSCNIRHVCFTDTGQSSSCPVPSENTQPVATKFGSYIILFILLILLNFEGIPLGTSCRFLLRFFSQISDRYVYSVISHRPFQRNGWSDWQKPTGVHWLDAFGIWPHQWHSPWIFEFKFSNSCISGMDSVKWLDAESIIRHEPFTTSMIFTLDFEDHIFKHLYL